jgi:SAM-dependent methyltransferase
LYEYDAAFYRLLASFALRSAERIVPMLTGVLPLRSVVDFGCGQGAWLRAWSQAGATVLGLDGPYVDRAQLLIEPSAFQAADLAEPIDLARQFDLVQSVEVAEHLPEARAETFVATLVSHGLLVLFSAALPGQGGENHINEQPLSYWRALFRKQGYLPVDYLRPLIAGDTQIQSWYRYNLLLYVRQDRVATLPAPLRAAIVPDGERLRDYRPLNCRLQQALVRQLPGFAVNRIARLRAALAARQHTASGGDVTPAR